MMQLRPTEAGLTGLRFFELAGLFIIAIATVIAGLQDIWRMVEAQHVHLADLLLLFIYLEVMAMVASYAESGKLPVRMPLYIGIVALARYLILDMKEIDNWRIIATAGAILMLALAVLIIRYGRSRFDDKESERLKWKPTKIDLSK
jgi:protein PsiE